MNIYWGDIHNHCGITYGYGSLENAIIAAREQLDFCSITGHAMWPDIPERTKELEFLIDYHQNGFKKLRENWENVRETIEHANVPHEFVTFHGYEMHSRKYGDHHILSPASDLPLIEAGSPKELVEKIYPRPCIAILHHAGYTPGYRGANWDAFSPEITPVVEVYSKHGCGVSESSMYPYLHTMGPRDSRSTVYSGLKKGHRFGFVASTDHHAGYPGSYGDGRIAVLASKKTREAIWDAILARRTYAVTGDKIKCLFNINQGTMGSEIQVTGSRQISLDVNACDEIDKIVVYKNLMPWKVINGEFLGCQDSKNDTYKIRIEMGWGHSNEPFDWKGNIELRDGIIKEVETCFRGRSVLAPSADMRDNPDINAIRNHIIEKNDTWVAWECTTFKNPTTLHPQTNALILEIKGGSNTTLNINVNNAKITTSIGELSNGSYSKHLDAYNSEAVLIHRAIPLSKYHFIGEWSDSDKQSNCDVYHVEIRQTNGQLAWVSPIYVL